MTSEAWIQRTKVGSKRTVPILLLILSFCFFSCAWESVDKKLERQTEQYNARYCPQRLDDFLTMDSMCYSVQGRVMHYYYSLRDDNLRDDAEKLGNLRQILADAHLADVRHSVALRHLRDHQVSFHYHYYSLPEHRPLWEMIYSPQDYR